MLEAMRLANGTVAYWPAPEQVNVLVTALLDGAAWMIVGQNWDWSVKGRDLGTYCAFGSTHGYRMVCSRHDDEVLRLPLVGEHILPLHAQTAVSWRAHTSSTCSDCRQLESTYYLYI